MPEDKIVLGTRGSDLARAQTRLVEQELRNAFPQFAVETRIIQTRGDQSRDDPFDSRAGRKGLFTGDIEEALRFHAIDVGVHSAKDLPSDSKLDLEICGALPRAAVGDLLLMRSEKNIVALPNGAKIATGSVRRKHQLLWKRRDLQIFALRGNVPTRLRKFLESDWDAIVLARAGLERLGYDLSQGILKIEGQSLNLEHLPVSDFLPAGGQGIIALESRRDDTAVLHCMRTINHLPTFSCLSAEREFLRLLQVDCNAPVGVLATIESGAMQLRAQVFRENEKPKMAQLRASIQEHQPEAIAKMLHATMYGES
jgi:hydroxymethylbilane synthase